jgi:hypothetical protein
MNQEIPVELESFSSKVKIVEQKLGVATEEFEVDKSLPQVELKRLKGPTLCEENYVDTAVEEETRAFVPKKRNFECLCSLLKKFYYSCTCDCLHICLKNFRTCMKVTLIVCVIAVGGYVLYQLWPFFSSIYAFFVRCYDFLKGIIDWVVDLFLEIYQWVTEAFEDVVEYMGQILDFADELPEMIEEFFFSAFCDIEQVVPSLNPKAAVEDFGETLKGYGNSIFDFLKEHLFKFFLPFIIELNEF